jgi:hypothetical protein
MEAASPARLYATAVGATLVVLGIVGFFYDLSWVNYFHVATGTLGLFVAGWGSRAYALCLGAIYTGMAIFSLPDASHLWLHLAIGLLGLAAAAGTATSRGSLTRHGRAKEPRGKARRLKPRAKSAAERP